MSAAERRKEDEAVARDFLARVTSGDLTAVDDLMAETINYTVITREPESEVLQLLPWVGLRRGRHAVRSYMRWLTANQSLDAMAIDLVVADGDGNVVLFGQIATTGLATKRSGRWEYALRLRVEDGRITAYHLFENSYEAASLHRVAGAWTVSTDGKARIVPDSHAVMEGSEADV